MSLVLVTPPAEEPITLSIAKLQCRVAYDFEDELFTDWIKAAREQCETDLKRAFITSSWQLNLDGFPPFIRACDRSLESLNGTSQDAIRFPIARILTVSAISYLDTTGTRQALDPSLYTLDPGDFARLVPAYGRTWPACRRYPNSVQISFTAGYGDATAVPSALKSAIRLLVAHQNENREAVVIGANATEMPLGVQRLVNTQRWGGNRP